MRVDTPTTEFDKYARDYRAQVHHPLRTLVAGDEEEFLRVKARRVQHLLSNVPNPRILEFGCGTGLLAKAFCDSGFSGGFEGCDVSSESLAAARRANYDTHFFPYSGKLPREEYDLVVASCVFHHIAPKERAGCVEQIFQTLRPGGLFVIYEHNLVNPLTRYVVKNTKLDENAIFLKVAESLSLMNEGGFSETKARYFMFFPPRMKRLTSVEKWLAGVPLGAQYEVVGCKGSIT